MKVVEFFIPFPESPNFESMLDLQSVIIYLDIYIYILDQAGVSLLMILREGPNSWDVQWELQWDKQSIVYLAYSLRPGT